MTLATFAVKSNAVRALYVFWCRAFALLGGRAIFWRGCLYPLYGVNGCAIAPICGWYLLGLYSASPSGWSLLLRRGAGPPGTSGARGWSGIGGISNNELNYQLLFTLFSIYRCDGPYGRCL